MIPRNQFFNSNLYKKTPKKHLKTGPKPLLINYVKKLPKETSNPFSDIFPEQPIYMPLPRRNYISILGNQGREYHEESESVINFILKDWNWKPIEPNIDFELSMAKVRFKPWDWRIDPIRKKQKINTTLDIFRNFNKLPDDVIKTIVEKAYE